MFEEIKIKYLHPGLNLGIQDIRNVWLLTTVPENLVLPYTRVILFSDFHYPASVSVIKH